jgi:hypothetical protein
LIYSLTRPRKGPTSGATTDGIIFHLWSHDEKVPSGNVTIAQSVGHVNLTDAAFKKGAADRPAPKPAAK